MSGDQGLDRAPKEDEADAVPFDDVTLGGLLGKGRYVSIHLA